MTEKPRLSLTFGTMAEPIANQLAAQNLAARQDDLGLTQRLADAVTLLAIQGGLTESSVSSARRWIINRVSRIAMPAGVKVGPREQMRPR